MVHHTFDGLTIHCMVGSRARLLRAVSVGIEMRPMGSKVMAIVEDTTSETHHRSAISDRYIHPNAAKHSAKQCAATLAVYRDACAAC